MDRNVLNVAMCHRRSCALLQHIPRTGLWAMSIAIAIGAGGSCAAARTPQQARQERVVPVAQNFDLRINETAAITGESLRLTFERVVEDSRCPTNTNCIWAGDAVVRIALAGANAERGTLNLHTLSETAAEGGFQKFRLRLVKLEPAPRESGVIPPEQYVATLIVR